MIISLFDKSVRVCFTNFRDVNENYFLKIIVDNYPQFKIVNYFRPQIQIFSISGNMGRIKKSKAQVKIFYTGENTNHPRHLKFKGNCVEDVDFSLGFDYINIHNYIRFPNWAKWFFCYNNSKDEIKAIFG